MIAMKFLPSLRSVYVPVCDCTTSAPHKYSIVRVIPEHLVLQMISKANPVGVARRPPIWMQDRNRSPSTSPGRWDFPV